MFLVSLYAVAITIGLCLYWFLHSSSTKKSQILQAAFSAESKDPPEDNGGCSSGMHYFKSHKSPRKVQLKEVHHSNETASVKVMTPDGVTLVQTHEQRRDDKIGAAPPPPHKRRPAPPPPPKQPPKRPPPPPPPVTPPPQVVVVVNGKSENIENKIVDHRIETKSPPTSQFSSSASSPQLGVSSYTPTSLSPPASCYSGECPSSPELPLPPPPKNLSSEILSDSDEPLPPPPESSDVNVQPRMLDSSSLIYPKNSYMSYRSERKLGRQGFDGKYRRSFHTSASSVDLTTLGSSFQDGKDGFSPNSWEQMHNIRQHGTTVIFHSDCLQTENRLQRSSSQDCVLIEEPAPKKTDNISSSKQQEAERNQSSNSINTQCSNNQGVSPKSVPYSPASHETNTCETQNILSGSHQNDITKVTSSESADNTVMNNPDSVNEDTSSLDNRIMTDDSFVDGESDTSFTNVDHNQNAVVKNNQTEDSNSKTLNGSDLNRINSATQTTDIPRIGRKPKTKEEIECEELSMDFINHCGDTTLKNLLVPSPNHKSISDYMEGLLNLELESGGFPIQRNYVANSTSTTNNENKQKDEKWINNEKCNSLFNSKMRISQCMEVNENQSIDDEIELKKRKDELVLSIEKKMDTLRNEQTNIREEMLQNELLGQEIASRLQKVAKPNEIEKYSLHVEEMEKIVNLLLSLSGRLARAENILKNMPKEGSSEEKKILEAKREKLREQHEDARRLKENIDRRSNQVSTFLHKYLTDDEYSDYDRFIKLKTKLIVDIRELDEKINLGEEQLAALSVVAHLWKSANS